MGSVLHTPRARERASWYESNLFEQVDRPAADGHFHRTDRYRRVAGRWQFLWAGQQYRTGSYRLCGRRYHLCVCLDCRVPRFDSREALGLACCPDCSLALLDRPSALRPVWAEEHEIALRQAAAVTRANASNRCRYTAEAIHNWCIYLFVRLGASLRLFFSGVDLCRTLYALSAGGERLSRLDQRWRAQAVARRSSRPRWRP